MALNYYNLEFPNPSGDEELDQRHLECVAFRYGLTPEQGGLGKFQHFKNIVDGLWNNPKYNSLKRHVWNSWSDWMLHNLCDHNWVAISGAKNSGKSDLIALWCVVNYIADPTHCKVLVMSTTLEGAKQRIWKYVTEYWDAIKGLPGQFLKSRSLIRGISYDMQQYSESAGIRLLASEPRMESESLDKIIGIKAPKTDGGPNPREGSLIIAIDEMTGCSPVILKAAEENLTANHNFQLIGMANFNSPFDTFGMFFKPKVGYDKLRDNMDEFENELGGISMILDAEKSPRILEGRDDCYWFPSRADMERDGEKWGRNSLAYYRFYRGRPSPKGPSESIYDPAEIVRGGAMGNAMWGMQRPVKCAFLDSARSGHGDLAMATCGRLGVSHRGVMTLQIDEQEVMKMDVTDTETPLSFQLMNNYRKWCEQRHIEPRFIGIDSTSSELIDIMHVHWSRDILGIESGGTASRSPVSATDRREAREVYANKATEIWYGAKPFFRGGQIRGITTELGKELCSRQHAQTARKEATRKLQVEDKNTYRKREKKSPDASDSMLGLVGLCKLRMGFKAIERTANEVRQELTAPPGSMSLPVSGRKKFELPSFKREKQDTGNPFRSGRRPLLRVQRLRYD